MYLETDEILVIAVIRPMVYELRFSSASSGESSIHKESSESRFSLYRAAVFNRCGRASRVFPQAIPFLHYLLN